MNEQIYLIKQGNSTSTATGEFTRTETRKQVFAELMSVKRNEFYQASASGFKPEISFKIYDFEYNGEQLVEYNNVKYKVYRTYNSQKEDMIELICTTYAGD